MRKIAVSTAAFVAVSSLLYAQQPQPSNTVPRLVRISSTFRPADGRLAAPVEGVTLSIYREERDGTPLWQEVQNVSVDSEGRYNALLGSTLNDGLPLELFTASGTTFRTHCTHLRHRGLCQFSNDGLRTWRDRDYVRITG